MVKVLGLGDNVCDVYLHTNTMYPGGQAVNFAVYTAQLGAASDYMGVFGSDAVAEHIKKTLEAKGIGFGHCRTYAGENGFARVTLVDGDRVFKGSNRGGVLREHPIYLDEADLDYVNGFDLIHTTNNGFTDELLPTLAKCRGLVSYDFSYRWNEEDRVERVCPYIDFALASCSDLGDEETEQLCRHFHDKGCKVVIATRGSKGATVYDGKRFYRQLPDYVDPVDTMGAGDSFAAAAILTLFEQLGHYSEGKWADDARRAEAFAAALKKAAAFSAQNCLVKGAFDCGTPVPEHLKERIYGEL